MILNHRDSTEHFFVEFSIAVPVNRTETITTPDTTENVTTRDTTKIITTPYTTEIITTPDMPNTTEIITTPNMHNAKEIITTPDTTKMSTEQSAGIRENPTLGVSSTSDITLPDSFENVSITSISSPIVTFHENWILSMESCISDSELQERYCAIIEQASAVGFLVPVNQMTKEHLPLLKTAMVQNQIESAKEELDDFVKIEPEVEHKKGKIVLTNNEKQTINVVDLDEHLVLPANKSKTDSKNKDENQAPQKTIETCSQTIDINEDVVSIDTNNLGKIEKQFLLDILPFIPMALN
ncbi:unnamed protein product [Mytilus coruscus]|uniref:Uncharacterized protein n=1 Tax=Mytilus coruscus TaxID=42192 RepID=A0A6J8CAY0_MYTCO|nr:unnamed protein product [Mytilus coruscus]